MQICRALLKYGYSNFSLTILEYCDKEKCIEREKHYIDFFGTGTEYNTVKDPSLPSMSGRKHSNKTKQIMSDAKQGQPRTEGAGRPSQQIEVTDIKNNQTTTYDSISAAAKV